MLKDDLLVKMLVSKNLITKQQADKARQESEKSGFSLEKTLDRLGFVSEKDIALCISQEFKVPYIDLSDYLIEPKVINLVPETLARKYKLIPVFKIQDSLTIAMVNPKDITAVDEVRLKSKCPVVETVISTETEIQKAIDQYYRVTGTMEDVIKGIGKERLESFREKPEVKTLEEVAEEPPVVKLVNLLFMQAIKDGASDIHIEPQGESLKVRFRIDGILHKITTPPKHLQDAIITRIKILSKMDISERRKPQDGKISLRMENKDLDLRVSTYPTINGENVVIRILDKSTVLFGLDKLGFSPKALKEYKRLITRPYGIILDTGPTGSGKTTTLYASLATINSEDKNIITIEDPVEYEIPLIRQSQINPKAGVTFATGLRAILRQDPDIVMVGEIRDKETAEIAIHASLTGHLVFSTLHTNDAAGAITRLINMGIEPFLISSSVIGIIAQRLVRRICPKCKQNYTPNKEMIEKLGLKKKKEILFYRGKGCKNCKQTGFKGREGIFELLIINDIVRELILNKAPANQIRQKVETLGMGTLWKQAIDKVLSGITTIEEAIRVVQEE